MRDASSTMRTLERKELQDKQSKADNMDLFKVEIESVLRSMCDTLSELYTLGGSNTNDIPGMILQGARMAGLCHEDIVACMWDIGAKLNAEWEGKAKEAYWSMRYGVACDCQSGWVCLQLNKTPATNTTNKE